MGQYYYTINLDKKEMLHPHVFDDGLKLMEFGQSGDGGTMTALALLLAVGNGRGGGDFRGEDPRGWVGRWAGDRIAIVGDYVEAGEVGYDLRRERRDELRDISREVLAMMKAAGEARGSR